MDTDRLLRIFGRMMDTHGDVFIGGFAAIFALILLVVISRRLRRRKAAKTAAPVMQAPVLDAEITHDVDLAMADDVGADDVGADDVGADDGGGGDAQSGAPRFDDTIIIADMQADELTDDVTHQFDADLDELDDLDDITIPKIGEAPPPKQSRFFSANWLGRKDKSDAPSISLDMTPTDDAQSFKANDGAAHKSAAECSRLGDIERKLMALRELYEAGLIAPEVYVVKAREFAAQV